MTARDVLNLPFVIVIRAYQVTLGPFMAGQCRFEPTCSHYALGAYRAHGPVRGTWLTVRRLARCHPFGGSGLDPVPLGSDRGGSGGAGREALASGTNLQGHEQTPGGGPA